MGRLSIDVTVDTKAWQQFSALASERIAEADNNVFFSRSFDEIFDAVQRSIKNT